MTVFKMTAAGKLTAVYSFRVHQCTDGAGQIQKVLSGRVEAFIALWG